MTREMNDKDVIVKRLMETDFSSECANKDIMRSRLLFKIARVENGADTKKAKHFRRSRFKPAVLAAAVLTLCISFTLLAYGEDIRRVIKEFTVGSFAKFLARDIVPANESLPIELRGKLFDAEGNVLSALPSDGIFFNERGEQVTLVYDAASDEISILAREEFDKSLKEARQRMPEIAVFENIDDVRPYLAFDFLMPAVLPDGYTFDRAELMKGDDGQIRAKDNNKYLSYYLTNGDKTKDISVMLRLMDEETAFVSSGTSYMKEVDINGYPGVMDVRTLHVEMDGVMYSLFSNDPASDGDELISLAKSME